MNKNKDGLYEQLVWARETLGIPMEVTIKEIKNAFRGAINKLHPDRNFNVDIEKTRDIIKANKLIMNYYQQIKISFTKDNVNKYRSFEEKWQKQFGDLGIF